MTIWIVRKHANYRFGGLSVAYEIVSTHATKAEAAAIVKRKNERSLYVYTVGKVTLKKTP